MRSHLIDGVSVPDPSDKCLIYDPDIGDYKTFPVHGFVDAVNSSLSDEGPDATRSAVDILIRVTERRLDAASGYIREGLQEAIEYAGSVRKAIPDSQPAAANG